MNELIIKTEFDKNLIQLKLKNKEELVEAIVQSFKPVFVITNDIDKKIAKNERAKLNNIVKALDRERIDRVADLVSNFENDCNDIKELIKNESVKWDKEIKSYEATQAEIIKSQGTLVEASDTTQKFIITIPNDAVLKKLVKFCETNNCTLEKGK